MEKKEESYWLVLSVLVYSGIMVGIMYSLPRFKRMYAEMLAGEPLPQITRLFCGIPFLGYMAIMILGVVLSGVVNSRLKSPGARNRLCVSVTLFSVLLAVLYTLAVFSPLFVCIDGRLR